MSDSRDNLGGKKGMTPQLKEVIVDTDLSTLRTSDQMEAELMFYLCAEELHIHLLLP